MVHIMRQRQSTSGITQTNRAHHRRQRTPSATMSLSHAERCYGHRWTESAQHVCQNIQIPTFVETKGPTDMFATMWTVKMLNFLGLSDIILQCDPGVITHKMSRKCQIQTHRKNSHSKFSRTCAIIIVFFNIIA